MNEEQEIRAKALEIAALVRGPFRFTEATYDADTVIRAYLSLADAAERRICGTLQPNPVKSEGTS
jgi:hypothetical protein